MGVGQAVAGSGIALAWFFFGPAGLRQEMHGRYAVGQAGIPDPTRRVYGDSVRGDGCQLARPAGPECRSRAPGKKVYVRAFGENRPRQNWGAMAQWTSTSTMAALL